jgi:outer membrane receptor for ferrienterochelin and colicins
MDVVERIEIVRGPGSALYGTGAMFAVINVITKKGLKGDGLRIGVEGGSFGKLFGKASFGHYFENDVDVSISGTAGRTDGKDIYFPEYDALETNNGVAHNLDWERFGNVLATVRYGKWSLQNMITTRSKGIPTGAFDVVFNDPSTKTLDVFSNTGLVYEDEIDDDKSITIRSSYLHYFYEGYYPYVQMTRDESIGDQLTLGGQILWDLSSKNRMVFGFEGVYSPTSSYFYSSPDVVYFDKNVSSSILSGYIHDEYQLLPFLTVIAGLRSDSYSYERTYLAPRIAIVVTPSLTTTMKFLYGGAFRAPNFSELYYEDLLTSIKHSVDLKPERIATSEAILEQRLGDQYFSVLSVYHYKMDGLIDYQLDEIDSLFQYRNINSILANGIEIGLQARYKSGVAVHVSYCFQEAADEKSNIKLTNSPNHVAKANLGIPVTDGVTVSTEFRYESKRITLANSSTGAYFLGNITLNMQLPLDGMECSLKIRNVFDRKYSVPGGLEHIQAAIKQDGRTVGFSLIYSFR